MAKVLVVEDNLVNQKLLQKILESLNLEVVCVATGEEGWALLSQPTHYDIIFLDMHLPKMDGFELARKVRLFKGDETKIVAVTAMAMSGDREKAIDAGCDDYISKPIFIEEIKRVVLKYLNKGD